MAAWIAVALADLGLPRARRELRARFGDGADLLAVARVGSKIRIEGVSVPFDRGRAVLDVVIDPLGGGSGPGALPVRIEAVDARMKLPAGPLGAVVVRARYRGVDAVGPGIVATGELDVDVRGDRLASPITLRSRVLVDADRVYLGGGEGSGPGLELQAEGSVARDGSNLRVRVSSRIWPCAFGRACGAPETALPRAEDAVEVRLVASGPAASPRVDVEADAKVLGFRFGAPRWVPPLEATRLTVRATYEGGRSTLDASAHSGEGEIALAVRPAPLVALSVRAWPSRWLAGARPWLPVDVREVFDRAVARGTVSAALVVPGREDLVLGGHVDIRAAGARLRIDPVRVVLPGGDPSGTRVSAALDLDEVLAGVTGEADVRGAVRVDVDVHGASSLGVLVRSASVSVGVRGEDVVLEDVVVEAPVVLGAHPVVAVEARAVAAGGAWTADGRVVFDGPMPSGSLAVRGECGPAVLAFAANAAADRAPRVRLTPADRGSSQPRGLGEIWLPRDARVSALAALDLAGLRASASAPPLLALSLCVTTATCALTGELRADRSRRFESSVTGRLSVAEAVDLALFDGGGGLPGPVGAVDVSLGIAGKGDEPLGVRLAGVFHADVLAFAPHVTLTDVHASLSTRGSVAVWHDVHARLARGRVVLSAVVDRDGALGGVRGYVRAEDVAILDLSLGIARGTLSAELVMEQHGPEDAPLLAEGHLRVTDVELVDVERVPAAGLPPSVLARNARAAGDVTARIGLSATALRLLDLVVPLPDGRLHGTVRLGFDGGLEAHLDVLLRGLLALPLRVRASRSMLRPEVEVDVLAAALVGVASARARGAPRPVTTALTVHPALHDAVTAIDWDDVVRRARRQVV